MKNGKVSALRMSFIINVFTLVELLIVIAIIAILMSILLPALQNAREKGKEIACLNNMKQTHMAVEFYCNDYGQTYRIPSNLPGVTASASGKYFWQELLLTEGYVSFAPGDSAFDNTLKKIPAIFQCPSVESNPASQNWSSWYGCHFGINGYMRGDWQDMNWLPNQRIEQAPSKTCYFSEKQKNICSDFVYPSFNNSSFVNDYNIDRRHMRSANVVYLDGHAKSMPEKMIPFSDGYLCVQDAIKSYFWRRRDMGPPWYDLP